MMRHNFIYTLVICLSLGLTLPVNAVSRQQKKIFDQEESYSEKSERSLWVKEVKPFYPSEHARKKNDRRLSIVGEKIYFNGKLLNLGDTLISWKKTIGGTPRCITEVVNFCVWDNLGLEISTSSKVDWTVTSLKVYLNFIVIDGSTSKYGASSRPSPAEMGDWLPHSRFQGSFDVDGFDINENTRFDEILKHVRHRNFRYGTLGCSSSIGKFDEKSKIYIDLNGRNPSARLRTFAISR